MRNQCLAALCLIGLAATAYADDWPQWLGPKRDSVYRETGVIDRIPAGGLKAKWRAPLGLGYSGPALADGRVFVMDYELADGEIRNNSAARNRLAGKERVLCFDAASGKSLWMHAYDRPYDLSFAGGPRCTPTIDGDRVYALGAEGNLFCLDTKTGRVLWSKDFAKDFNTETAIWGVASHPLVDGDLLYCVVGGEGSVAVAFDKLTGREVWRALSARQPGYCPPTMIEHAGRKQLVIWHGEAINGLDPKTGKVYWSAPLKPNFGMSIATPRLAGSYLFASGFGEAGVLLKLDDQEAKVAWRGEAKTALYSGTSSPFIENETIYGCDVGTGALMAVRLSDGERLWQTTEPTLGKVPRGRYGTAFIVKHQDRYFLFSETGDLILAKLSPKAYEELGRGHVLEPTNEAFGRPVVWSHPAFGQRCLFARNDKELVCVSLAADEGK